MYSLRAINGDTLPIVTTEPSGVTTIYGGEFELTSGGAFRALTDVGFRDAGTGGNRRSGSTQVGLYRRNDHTFEFIYLNGHRNDGSLRSDTLEVVDAGLFAVYVKTRGATL